MTFYPTRLLPKKNSPKIDPPATEDLLLRQVKHEEYLFNNGKLRADALNVDDEEGDLLSLSFNIKPKSRPHDLRINLTNRALRNKWSPGEAVISRVQKSDYHIENDRQCFGLQVGDLTFSESVPKSAGGNKPKKPHTFKFCMKHDPLVANYYHFILQVTDEDGKILKYKSGTEYKYILATIVFEQIRRKAKVVEHLRDVFHRLGLFLP